jgi:hypothetical protein
MLHVGCDAAGGKKVCDRLLEGSGIEGILARDADAGAGRQCVLGTV